MKNPTNTLDENEINSLFETILKLKEKGKTILLISNYVYLLWKFFERVILMKDGRLQADRNKYDIMKEEKLLRSCNISVPEVAKIYNIIN